MKTDSHPLEGFRGRCSCSGDGAGNAKGRRYPWLSLGVAMVLLGGWVVGCGDTRPEVVVFAAQDRVFAQPILAEFERTAAVRARALYDSEATKTVGLANRLIAEAARPRADVWWSNEEMRTRQLVARGILEPGWRAFGGRQRVLVVRTDSEATRGVSWDLAMLTNAVWRGRVAIAYPVFGSTTTHLLALRQRWGEVAWKAWCRALAANRPLMVDGNSVVARLVGRGDVVVGLTDSDDVAFGRREGLPIEAVALMEGEGLRLPNAVALVVGGPQPEAGRRLAEFLVGPWVAERLRAEGAIDPVPAGGSEARGQGLTEAQWEALLADLDTSLEWLRETFVR